MPKTKTCIGTLFSVTKKKLLVNIYLPFKEREVMVDHLYICDL